MTLSTSVLRMAYESIVLLGCNGAEDPLLEIAYSVINIGLDRVLRTQHLEQCHVDKPTS